MIAVEPALETFVQDVRAALAAGDALEPTVQRIADALPPLLADPTWREARGLPLPGEPRYYLLYEDSDYGFVVTSCTTPRATSGWIHDHGSMWTVYGVQAGHEAVYRYERRMTAARGLRRDSLHDPPGRWAWQRGLRAALRDPQRGERERCAVVRDHRPQ